MGFDKKEKARKYTPKDGDTLSIIAARERAAGNYLEWQDIARFNWGTDDPNEVNIFLRDELGARLRDADNNFVISADDEPQGELLIPVRFKKQGLQVNKTHKISLKTTPEPSAQFKQCCAIPGVTFETDQSFVRPSVVDALKELDKIAHQFPDAKIMIFGHTDKVGDELYNAKLSARRAKSVYAFITQDVATWEQLYTDENWGTKAIQEMLKDFGDPYDPGTVDGINGPKTEAAIKKFQTDNGLKADGSAGPKTRKEMFTKYMSGKHDVAIEEARFLDPKHIGCGEFNPLVGTDKADEANRRVVFYLFNPDRPPKFPCAEGDIVPCKKQMNPPSPRYVETFSCSFYDSVAKDCGCETKPAAVKPLAFTLISPMQKEKDKPNKQYVNCATTNAGVDGNNNVVEITISAKVEPNLRPVRNGDIAHIEVLFGLETGRNEPKPKLDVADAQELDSGKKFKGTVKFEGGNTTAKFKIDLGLAGSETCEVKVGVDDSCGDAILKFENWRKLEYQIVSPDFIKDDIGAEDLPQKSRDFINGGATGLKPVFVEFEKKQWSNFTAAECGAGFVFKPEFFHEPAGRDLYVLPPGGKNPPPKPFTAPTTRTINIQLADKGVSWNGEDYVQVNPEISALNASGVFNLNISVAAIDKRSMPKALGLVSKPGGGTLPVGTAGINKVGGAWLALPPAAPANHPGKNGAGAAKSGTLDDWTITHRTNAFIAIKPPAAVAAFIGASSATKCPVKVSFKFLSVHEVNGTAGGGGMLLIYKKPAPESMASTICHELGHAMGMTIVPTGNMVPPGVTAPTHVDSAPPGTYYINGTPVGANGRRNLHVGPHCAHGVAEADLADAKFNDKDGDCIMFGSGGSDDASNKRKSYCDTCTKMVKARNLRDIRTGFASGDRDAKDA